MAVAVIGEQSADPAPASASSWADPSREPLSTTTISNSGQLRIVRSDHSKNAVSSRVLYETIRAVTLSRRLLGPATTPRHWPPAKPAT